ncbi:MAG: hypothetical protein M1371_05835 [Actinobacteria bacterium]|nr:hypothetical protein [Actinomycetota bacterium]
MRSFRLIVAIYLFVIAFFVLGLLFPMPGFISGRLLYWLILAGNIVAGIMLLRR